MGELYRSSSPNPNPFYLYTDKSKAKINGATYPLSHTWVATGLGLRPKLLLWAPLSLEKLASARWAGLGPRPGRRPASGLCEDQVASMQNLMLPVPWLQLIWDATPSSPLPCIYFQTWTKGNLWWRLPILQQRIPLVWESELTAV